jgi:hypothetical protein
MIGQREGAQNQLFYSFRLDTHVPSDHLLRGIDRFVTGQGACTTHA